MIEIDWSLLLLKLRRHHSTNEISKICHIDPIHLGRMSRLEIKQPKFDRGVALLDLAYDTLPENEFKQLRIN